MSHTQKLEYYFIVLWDYNSVDLTHGSIQVMFLAHSWRSLSLNSYNGGVPLLGSDTIGLTFSFTYFMGLHAILWKLSGPIDKDISHLFYGAGPIHYLYSTLVILTVWPAYLVCLSWSFVLEGNNVNNPQLANQQIYMCMYMYV